MSETDVSTAAPDGKCSPRSAVTCSARVTFRVEAKVRAQVTFYNRVRAPTSAKPDAPDGAASGPRRRLAPLRRDAFGDRRRRDAPGLRADHGAGRPAAGQHRVLQQVLRDLRPAVQTQHTG